MDWGSASAAPAPGHDDGARREGVASHNHHHGLKEKMRALTLDYERHKQQLSASQGGAARGSTAAASGASTRGRW
jgi:kinesin family member 18/19